MAPNTTTPRYQNTYLSKPYKEDWPWDQNIATFLTQKIGIIVPIKSLPRLLNRIVASKFGNTENIISLTSPLKTAIYLISTGPACTYSALLVIITINIITMTKPKPISSTQLFKARSCGSNWNRVCAHTVPNACKEDTGMMKIRPRRRFRR